MDQPVTNSNKQINKNLYYFTYNTKRPPSCYICTNTCGLVLLKWSHLSGLSPPLPPPPPSSHYSAPLLSLIILLFEGRWAQSWVTSTSFFVINLGVAPEGLSQCRTLCISTNKQYTAIMLMMKEKKEKNTSNQHWCLLMRYCGGSPPLIGCCATSSHTPHVLTLWPQNLHVTENSPVQQDHSGWGRAFSVSQKKKKHARDVSRSKQAVVGSHLSSTRNFKSFPPAVTKKTGRRQFVFIKLHYDSISASNCTRCSFYEGTSFLHSVVSQAGVLTIRVIHQLWCCSSCSTILLHVYLQQLLCYWWHATTKNLKNLVRLVKDWPWPECQRCTPEHSGKCLALSLTYTVSSNTNLIN